MPTCPPKMCIRDRIKLLLVPADPQDGRNAILEIRCGTGGDEAAIVAGDLFRMYTKYCETKGWRMEISSANEGARPIHISVCRIHCRPSRSKMCIRDSISISSSIFFKASVLFRPP